jgi:uncharacterized protein (TIGR02284 family)
MALETTKDIGNILNGLIETAKDGEQGFRQAAEKAKDPSLQSLFTKYATQRASYVRELQTLVVGLGEKPAESGHIAGAFHRGWVDLKAALTKNEDKALINEAEAGEDATVKNYRQALANPLPPEISQVINRQYAGVQEAHSVVRDLKHGVASTTTAAGSRL